MSQPPAYSTFRFVAARPQSPGDGRKRIASRACDDCRRKKKRCAHEVGSQRQSSTPQDGPQVLSASHSLRDGGVSSTPPSGVLDRPPVQSAVAMASVEPQQQRHVRPVSDHSTRFIGDLNPEVELLSAASPGHPRKNGIGVWHEEEAQRPSGSGLDLFSPASLFHALPAAAQGALLPFLLENSLSTLPPTHHMVALQMFYIENIHPILPAVDLQSFEEMVEGPIRVFQQHMICLLVSPVFELREHLVLGPGDEILSPTEFSSRILAAMRLTLGMGLIANRSIIVRGLAIMSIASTGRHNHEFSSQFFARAVHLSFTMGLHLPRDGRQDERSDSLFCLLWSLDRMHAAIHGRPVLMHAADMGKSAAVCSQNQAPGFKTLVYVAVLLDRVIGLYRPDAYAVEIPDVEFPRFDEILAECGATQLPSQMLATLELFYHATAILSCRRRSSDDSPALAMRNSRQTSSAMQVIDVMEDTDATGLFPLPFVPYAVSLACAAACRELRLSKVATQRHRAARRLQQCCQHLRRFGTAYWSAKLMAEMATKILKDLETNAASTTLAVQSDDHQCNTKARAPIDDALFDMVSPHWDIGDMDMEGLLDPSMPTLFQDIDFAYLHE